jgi:hypothetical protein
MEDKRLQELRDIYRLGAPRIWISMFSQNQLTPKELVFLNDHWIKQHGDKELQDLAKKFGGDIITT